jgi:hypothetical protein
MEARARGPAVKALDLRRSDFDEPEAQRIELRGCRHQHATIFKRCIAGYELFFPVAASTSSIRAMIWRGCYLSWPEGTEGVPPVDAQIEEGPSRLRNGSLRGDEILGLASNPLSGRIRVVHAPSLAAASAVA